MRKHHFFKGAASLLLALSLLLGLIPAIPAKAAGEVCVSISAHVQNKGWMDGKVIDGMSEGGTEGESLRLEAVRLNLVNTTGISGGLQYQSHVQDYGWINPPVKEGDVSGTVGESRRAEAIRIALTGDLAKSYDIYYQVHIQNYGWMDWASNWQEAGSSGQSLRMEAIRIKIVQKGGGAPGNTKTPYVDTAISYQAHVQNDGWKAPVQNFSLVPASADNDKETAGTVGASLRMEGVIVNLSTSYEGGIEYSAHVQDYGWRDPVSSGILAGTEGESRRLEAITIKLTGQVADHYDIYYRVHCQDIGWMGWTKNGDRAGTAGMSKRLEAIQIRLVNKDKGDPTPDTNRQAYVEVTAPAAPAPATPTSPTTPAGPVSSLSEQQEVLRIVNEERGKAGIAPLTLDEKLCQAANVRAQEIVHKDSHTRPDGRSCFTVLKDMGIPYRGAGENIAAGQHNPEEVMIAWMNSPGHCKNILNPAYTKLGVGYYHDPGTWYQDYWVQLFTY